MLNWNSASRHDSPTKDKHAIQLILASHPTTPMHDHQLQTQVERTHLWAARAAAEHRARTNLVPTPALIKYRQAFHPAPEPMRNVLNTFFAKLWSFA